MSQDDQTIGVYDAQADEYNRIATEAATDKNLIAFMAGLPKGARILDLGCGPGHAAAYMQDRGFSVLASDASAEMIAMARDTYGLEATQATFADLKDVDAFDAVWASFSLLHAAKSDMPRHLAAIHRALRPGGVFCIGLKTGEGETRDEIGRFYSYYSDAELSNLLEVAGFTIQTRATGEGSGLDGRIWPWIVITCHA